eukprot:6334403-Prymnesium_polylepis.2
MSFATVAGTRSSKLWPLSARFRTVVEEMCAKRCGASMYRVIGGRLASSSKGPSITCSASTISSSPSLAHVRMPRYTYRTPCRSANRHGYCGTTTASTRPASSGSASHAAATIAWRASTLTGYFLFGLKARQA